MSTRLKGVDIFCAGNQPAWLGSCCASSWRQWEAISAVVLADCCIVSTLSRSVFAADRLHVMIFTSRGAAGSRMQFGRQADRNRSRPSARSPARGSRRECLPLASDRSRRGSRAGRAETAVMDTGRCRLACGQTNVIRTTPDDNLAMLHSIMSLSTHDGNTSRTLASSIRPHGQLWKSLFAYANCNLPLGEKLQNFMKLYNVMELSTNFIHWVISPQFHHSHCNKENYWRIVQYDWS